MRSFAMGLVLAVHSTQKLKLTKLVRISLSTSKLGKVEIFVFILTQDLVNILISYFSNVFRYDDKKL